MTAEKRDEVESSRETALACIEALSSSLGSLERSHPSLARSVHVHVFASGTDHWQDFTYDALGKGPHTMKVHKVRQGNSASFEDMLGIIRELNLTSDAIGLLLEDDVMLMDAALEEIVEIFDSHNPCFVKPSDTADDYILGVSEEVSITRRHADNGAAKMYILFRDDTMHASQLFLFLLLLLLLLRHSLANLLWSAGGEGIGGRQVARL